MVDTHISARNLRLFVSLLAGGLLSILMVAVFSPSAFAGNLPVKDACSAVIGWESNLIANGDAEANLGANDATTVVTPDCWNASSSFTAVRYGASDFPVSGTVPNGGANFFAGGPNSAVATATQLSDISSLSQTIDSGNVIATLSGFLGGFAQQADSMVVVAEFRTGDQQTLGQIQIGPVTVQERANTTTLLARSTSGKVPVGARQVVLTMRATRAEGTYNDGYADNISFIVQESLALTKSVSPVSARPGQPVTYTIAFTNTGPITATNVILTDTLAASIINASYTSSGVVLTQVPASRYVWTAPDLAPNQGGVITLTGVLTSPLAAGTIPNTVTLAVSGTVQTANANLTVENVTPVADLSLSLTDGKDYAVSGNPITYVLIVANAGPDAANGAVVTDTLPASINNVTWTCVASGGSCGALSGSGNLSTTVSLNAGGMITFTIGGRLSSGATGTLIDTAYVSHPTDPSPGNNSAADSDVVLYIKLYLPLVIR